MNTLMDLLAYEMQEKASYVLTPCNPYQHIYQKLYY